MLNTQLWFKFEIPVDETEVGTTFFVLVIPVVEETDFSKVKKDAVKINQQKTDCLILLYIVCIVYWFIVNWKRNVKHPRLTT